jgi:hypothetical protein
MPETEGGVLEAPLRRWHWNWTEAGEEANPTGSGRKVLTEGTEELCSYGRLSQADLVGV